MKPTKLSRDFGEGEILILEWPRVEANFFFSLFNMYTCKLCKSPLVAAVTPQKWQSHSSLPASLVFSLKTYSLPVCIGMVPRAIQALLCHQARCQIALRWFSCPKEGIELPTFPWGYTAHSSQPRTSIKNQLCHFIPTFLFFLSIASLLLYRLNALAVSASFQSLTEK